MSGRECLLMVLIPEEVARLRVADVDVFGSS